MMTSLGVLLLIVTTLITIDVATAEDFTPNLVTKMPGWSGDLPFKMHTGYLKGGELKI